MAFSSKGGVWHVYQQIDQMNYLNLGELQRLCSHFQGSALREALWEGQKREGLLLGAEGEQWSLLELGRKVNERESWKASSLKNRKNLYRPERWMFGEFKIFVAVTLLHAHIHGLSLGQLTHADAACLHAVFQAKTIQFVSYELANLIHNQQKNRRPWSHQEETLLKAIIDRSKGQIQWRTVSVQLFSESRGLFFRGQKDCREKWRNYLDPAVLKQEWSEEEDQKLLHLVQSHGQRWSYIARRFHGTRTEHMVKNRYNSFIKNWRNKKPKKCVKEGRAKQPVEAKQLESSPQESIQLKQQQQMEQEREVVGVLEAVKEMKNEQTRQNNHKQREDLLCSQYIEQKMQQTTNNDKFLKRTNDEEELLPKPLRAGFEGVFSMEPEAKLTAMSEVVAALGCSHFEAMLDSYSEYAPEEGTFDWLCE